MGFEISARTILHLGADLISSDAVALYELIKNAIDARSPDGVDVEFEITLLESDLASYLVRLENASDDDVETLKEGILSSLQTDAPEKLLDRFHKIISTASTVKSLHEKLINAYRKCNRIVISDRGHGMSLTDLKDIYLKIGTTNREREVRKALEAGKTDNLKSPYLGEKGVGRLSAMRLGWALRVETTTAEDSNINLLNINWRAFEEAYDMPASSIDIKPEVGKEKPSGLISGTRIHISDLRAEWTPENIKNIAIEQISRMTDPFSWTERRRFQIRLKYNGTPIEHTRTVAKELLANAHAACKGRYEIINEEPTLTVTFVSKIYDGQETKEKFDLVDLISMSGLAKTELASSVLRNLGPFSFQFYWFNRQRLRAYPGVGDREAVRSLVKKWAGICLFRDGYRVLPYGDEGDDWLALDREALSASGYKLNTKQIIGRVQIGRLTNPKLLDQTNRQGLIVCPEKKVLITILRELIADRWHRYLNEASNTQKKKETLEFDSVQSSNVVDSLEKRANSSLKEIRKHYSGDAQLIQETMDAFKEIKDAHVRAVARIESMEEEKERLTQLAGIGLMVEVIAHELTRATELTQSTLKSIGKNKVDDKTSAAFKTLSEQIKVIHKRLRLMEPLSIPARQRRSYRSIEEIVNYVIEGHEAQFTRHGINVHVETDGLGSSAFIIEGHVVQILENLIDNSIYWLDLYAKEHPSFVPQVDIKVQSNPPKVFFTDNGPGIPTSRVESVFEPFYTTKESSKSRRKGLGLYISRQNAELLEGELNLVEEGLVHPGRFNAFELALKREAQ